MKYNEFLEQVQRRAHLASRSEAERATQAALETLAEGLSKEERREAASQLARTLTLFLKQPFLGQLKQPSPRWEQPFSLEEFFQRVGFREDVSPAVAREHAHAVINVLFDALSPGEREEIRKQLPIEYFYEFFAETGQRAQVEPG